MGNTISSENTKPISEKEVFVNKITNEIVQQSSDVITAFVDTSWDQNDEIIKGLAKLGGNIFISEWQKLRHTHANHCQVGDIFRATSPCGLKSRHILFAVWKEKDAESSSDEQINFVVYNLLCRAKELDESVYTIAMPVGTTGMVFETHVKIINNIFIWLIQFEQKTTTHIHVLASNDEITEILRNALKPFKDVLSKQPALKPESEDPNSVERENLLLSTKTNGCDFNRCYDFGSETPRYSFSSEESIYEKVIDTFPEKESIWKYYTGTNEEFQSINRKRKLRSVQFDEVAQEYSRETGRPVERTLSQSSLDEVVLTYTNFKSKKKRRRRRDERFFCSICQDEKGLENKEILSKCRHEFCRDCIKVHFAEVSPSCPVCKKFYGKPLGNQPHGIMYFEELNKYLPGFPGTDTIVINYDIPDGIQNENHPNPGAPFKGTHRTAYLPATEKGRKVHRLLTKAFDQRLIFTVGKSVTTGRENVVTWNDIHHKTRPDGGPERYGYPDPEYLDRVLDQLHRAGIKDD